MQKLHDFVNTINEHRGRPRKEIDPDEFTDKEKDVIAKKAKKVEKVKGKDAEKNGSHGTWAVEPPYDDGAVTKLTKEDMNKNLKRLKMKFDAEDPFFIQGEAGWGKTSIIKDMAKRHKRHIITVYLDKAVASDLGGIPVPVQGKTGVAKIVNAMPDWAAYMLEHKDEQFLLFFDEMNQAAPDVMNALMPIVLENVICNIKYDNFMVGAAGNFQYENESGITELSGPLKSRFKPIIIWETGDDASWKQAFTYMHKEWDGKLPKELIDKFADNAQIFVNPREVEHKLLKYIDKIKKSEDKELYDTDDYLDYLERLCKEDLSRTEQDVLKELAVDLYNYINDVSSKSGRSGSRGKGIDMIDDTLKNKIKEGMKRGYITQIENGKAVKYGVSRENINDIFCTDGDDACVEEPINAEMLDRLINKYEADNIKFKFEKNSEWEKAGYKDPLEE